MVAVATTSLNDFIATLLSQNRMMCRLMLHKVAIRVRFFGEIAASYTRLPGSTFAPEGRSPEELLALVNGEFNLLRDGSIGSRN